MHVAYRSIRIVVHHLGEDPFGLVQFVVVEKLQTLAKLAPQVRVGLEQALSRGRQPQAQQAWNCD